MPSVQYHGNVRNERSLSSACDKIVDIVLLPWQHSLPQKNYYCHCRVHVIKLWMLSCFHGNTAYPDVVGLV